MSNYRMWNVTSLGPQPKVWYHVQVRVRAYLDTWETKKKFKDYNQALRELMYFRHTYDEPQITESLVDV